MLTLGIVSILPLLSLTRILAHALHRVLEFPDEEVNLWRPLPVTGSKVELFDLRVSKVCYLILGLDKFIVLIVRHLDSFFYINILMTSLVPSYLEIHCMTFQPPRL